MGIEPTFTAWEAVVLPLDDTRMSPRSDASRYRRVLQEPSQPAILAESPKRSDRLANAVTLAPSQ